MNPAGDLRTLRDEKAHAQADPTRALDNVLKDIVN